jgi:hypothetical protein
MTDLPSKTFCVFPFTHLVVHNIGTYGPCCAAEEFTSVDYNGNQFTSGMFQPHTQKIKPYGMTTDEAFYSEFQTDIRKQLLDGKKPSACIRCWKDESVPRLKSKRIDNNEFYLGLRPEFEGIFDYNVDDMINHPQLQSLDLKFSNKCNLHCLMCASGSSDMWEPLDKKIHNYFAMKNIDPDAIKGLYYGNEHSKRITETDACKPFPDTLFEEIKSLIPQLQEIQCTGGDPFVNAHFIELLNYAVETGHAGHIALEITTNGTKFVTDIMELLIHFRHVRFLVSIDGTEGTYDYIRAPFSYTLLLERMQTLDEYLVAGKIRGWVEINPVAMSYNIFDYVKLSAITDSMECQADWFGNVSFTLYNIDNPLHIKWLPDALIFEALQYYKSLLTHPKIDTNVPALVISGFEGYIKNNYADSATKLYNQRRMKNYTLLMDKMLNRDYHDFLDHRICKFLDSVEGDL